MLPLARIAQGPERLSSSAAVTGRLRRIVIAAIRDFGVKSPTGIDTDPQQIEETAGERPAAPAG